MIIIYFESKLTAGLRIIFSSIIFISHFFIENYYALGVSLILYTFWLILFFIVFVYGAGCETLIDGIWAYITFFLIITSLVFYIILSISMISMGPSVTLRPENQIYYDLSYIFSILLIVFNIIFLIILYNLGSIAGFLGTTSGS